MANTNKDVNKILQDLKAKKQNSVSSSSLYAQIPPNLQNIISQETQAAKKDTSSATQNIATGVAIDMQAFALQEQKQEQKEFAQKITTLNSVLEETPTVDKPDENDFLSKLAVALNEKEPAVSADFLKTEPIKLTDTAQSTKFTAESMVDDRFVDFFTQSIAVPKNPTTEIVVKKKKHGFFKKKYITDSLSLSIPQEEILRAEQTMATNKNDTMELAKQIIQTSTAPKPAPISATPTDAESVLKSVFAKKSGLQTPAGGVFTAPGFTEENQQKEIKVETRAQQDLVQDITAMFSSKDIEMAASDKKEPVTERQPEIPSLSLNEEEAPVFQEYVLENELVAQYGTEDPEEILEELKSFKSTLSIRILMSIICAGVLIYLNTAATLNLPLPQFMSATAQPLLFYMVSLLFFFIAIIGFLPTIISGFSGLFSTPTSDSFLSVPTVLCFIQLITATALSSKLDPTKTTIFAGFAVAALGCNALGKLICANTILRNLHLANVPDGINAGYLVNDFEDVKRLARTLEEKRLQILVSRKTGYISNFISGGFSAHRSEKRSKTLALGAIAISFLCFGIVLIYAKDITKALFAATAASVFTLPLSHTLISSVPSSLMQKSLNQVGTLVNGWQGIYQISDTTHVSFDAKHLFPKGSVVLHGIKTFEKERLDLAILYAASIAVEKCDNLRSVFLTVIDGKKEMLFPLESCEYKVGQGYIAWIEHNRVIMGNRNIMSEYDVELPPLSMETKFTSEGKKPIYLSVNGKLFGMFVVSYHPDKEAKENLERLIETGKCVILQSNDFNVDSQLLELVYDLPTDTVQVLNQNETALLLNYTQYSEKTESAMAHLDSLYSLVAGFIGADSAKSAASTCSIVQIISMVIGAILAILFSFSQTITEIPLISVLLLGAGWMGLCLMRALASRYY